MEECLKTCHVPAEHPIRESIPTSVVLPIIHRYLEGYGETGMGSNNRGTGAISILAKNAGIGVSTFMSMLTRRETLSFDNVDRILCAMDQPWQWYEWPLLVFYLSAEAPKVCAQEGCENEFRQPLHYNGTKYCLAHRSRGGNAWYKARAAA
jgi:hypothetical protein